MRCVWVGSEWHGWRGGEWTRGLGLGFTDPVRTCEVLDVCLDLRLCGWCRWGVGLGLYCI